MSRKFRTYASRWLAALALASVPFAVSANQAGNSRELSQQERALLERGALVQRRLTQRRGSLDLIGGTSYQVIDARPAVVWRALLDTARYPRMMPRVLEARVVGRVRDQRTVFMRQGAGPIEKAYYLRLNVDSVQQDITFVMDDTRPHDLKAAWGFYTVRPYGAGDRTLLVYGVMADIGGGMMVALVRDQVHDWLLKVPSTVKRFVEGSGKRLYLSDSVPDSAGARPRG